LSVLGVEPVELGHRLLDRLRAEEILMLHEVEVGMRLPQRVREALVAGKSGSSPGATNCPWLRFCCISRKCVSVFAPVLHLVLHQARGIGHRLVPVGHSGLQIQVLPRPLETHVPRRPARQGRHQTLRQFLDPGEVLVQPIEVLAHLALPP
jgi:hypothetical protein